MKPRWISGEKKKPPKISVENGVFQWIDGGTVWGINVHQIADSVEMSVVEQAAEQHSRMIECSLIAGERSRAHRAVDRAFEMIAELTNETIELETPIVNIPEITLRTANQLENVGVLTLAQLLAIPERRLIVKGGIGDGTMTLLRRIRDQYEHLLDLV